MTHPNIIRLQNGEGLCPECGEFSKHHWADDTCGNNCRHNTMMNTRAVVAITWNNMVCEVERLSHDHHDYVAKFYPEILEAKIEKEERDDAEYYAAERRNEISDFGSSLFEMMGAIGKAQTMQAQIDAFFKRKD